ncbi:MAG: ribonuclease III [Bacteroidaceae bacterium]|nr:ribonuclease III [Bacteroidaceae bacterium]
MPTNIIDRIKLPFRKDRELCASLREILGFYPHRLRYYKLALQHKSTSNHANGHNERLEFLGDAVLESIVSDILYHRFPNRREGFLTNTRSKIVQRETLNRLSRELGLDHLIHSAGNNHSHNSHMGGNAFEALVGAVYLDRGYDACMHFMRDRILRQIINIDQMAAEEVNFKSKLIEWAQKNRLQLEFRIIEERCEDHASPTFVTRIVVEGLDCETGKGYSKKESHQQAAKATLKALKSDKMLSQSILAARDQRLENNII